jgi:Tfp pilus assembly protein PilZ
MIGSDPQLGSFNITARLFKLIQDMPKDQQHIILKQLVGDNVTTHIHKLIIEMSEDQQRTLLEKMGGIPTIEVPVTTVSLEEAETSMRENPRKPCLINANYKIQGQTFKSYILDISIGGVFIETSEKFPIGKEVVLKFSLPNHPQPFTLVGKIAWTSPRGIGLKFDDVTFQQGDMLKSFVEEKD